MDPFSNYRRHVANWSGSGPSEPRQSLLPNPTTPPAAAYGRRQHQPEPWAIKPDNYGFQRQFNPQPSSGQGTMQRFQSNFSSNFKREYQSFDEPAPQQSFNRFQSQSQPQPLLANPRFEPFQRWENQDRRSGGGAGGDNWKSKNKPNQQKFGKSKPKQNNWGKKRRNPSKEEEKSKKLHTDENECWNSDGGVFVIDDELEQTITKKSESGDADEASAVKNEFDQDVQLSDKDDGQTGSKKQDDDSDAISTPSTKSQNTHSPSIPMDRRGDKYYCALCDAKCGNENNYRFHCDGNRHLRNLNASKGIPMSPRKPSEKGGQGLIEDKPPLIDTVPDNTPEQFTENVSDTGIPKPQISLMQNKLNSYQAPLIGLNYIIELQSENQFCEPKYECSLCETKCDSTSLLAHVTGSEHRMTYMGKHYKSEYDRLSNARGSKDEFAVELIRAVEKIQRTDGRGQMQVQSGFGKSPASSVSSDKSKRWVFKEPTSLTPNQYYLDLQRAKWKDNAAGNKEEHFTTDSFDGFDKDDSKKNKNSQTQQAVVEPTPDPVDDNPFSKILEDDPDSLSLSKGSLGALLRVLSKCEVKNEEDAQMALQVSNALTASLFKYRVQSMSSECVQVLNSNLSGTALKLLVGETKTEDLTTAKPSDQS
uniref:U1-type domain-containing protein n=1 Tax=Strigamia maritima TaxID=126957 RepID=T1J8D2_STRMM